MLLTQSGESSLVNAVIANAGGNRKQSRVHLYGEAGSRLASRDYRLHELGVHFFWPVRKLLLDFGKDLTGSNFGSSDTILFGTCGDGFRLCQNSLC